MKHHTSLRALGLILSVLLLASCAGPTPLDKIMVKQEPTATAPSSKVADVKVDLADCYGTSIGGFVIRSETNVPSDYKLLYWGNEVVVTLTVLGDPIVTDDMRKRIAVTPAVDYQLAITDQTGARQCQIRFATQDLSNLEIKISGQPTVEQAPRFAQDLEYRLERTDEPKFAISCSEHPEISYGASSVVPPGPKHFTIIFTQPVTPDGTQEVLRTRYHAQDITWESDRKVSFSADLKLGDRLAIVPPTKTDARGVPFNWVRSDGGYIWCGKDTPMVTVAGPNQFASGNLISGLIMDAVISPKGDFAVIAEEVPNFAEEATVADISIMNLADGQKTTIFQNISSIGPCFGTLWQPNGERLWVVEGLGTFADRQTRRVRLLDPHRGEIAVTSLNISDRDNILAAAVSPLDGSLIVGLAGGEAKNNRLPFRLKIFSPDGEFVYELAAGWVAQSAVQTKRMLWQADGRSAQIQLRSGFAKDEAGPPQPVTAVIDLMAGEVKMTNISVTAGFSPLGNFYVQANPQKSQMVYRATGELLGDLGVLSPLVYWSPDEKRLAYLDDNRHLMVFDLATKQATQWFDRPVAKVLGWNAAGVLVTE